MEKVRYYRRGRPGTSMGIGIEPMEAVSATAEPDIAANNAEASIFIWASPPLGVIIIYQSKKYNYPKEEGGVSVKVAIWTMLECCPAIITPCIIMIGVFTGWFTATESVVIAGIWIL